MSQEVVHSIPPPIKNDFPLPGIAVIKGGRGTLWGVLGSIGLGWVVTPVIAGVVCFIGLFFLQNEFNQIV